MTTTPHTATVSDEAVQAAANGAHEELISMASEMKLPMKYKESISVGNYRVMRRALTAALPHLAISPAPCTVEVAELDWSYDKAETDFGAYIVDSGFKDKIGSDRWYSWYLSSDNQDKDPFYGWQHGERAETKDAAKAAAQADFDRRVLSQIVTKPVDVAAVRRQAFEEAYKRAAEAVQKSLEVSEDYAWDEAEGIYHLIMGLIDTHPNTIRALSPAEPVDQSRVAQLEAALTSILFEDSDKSEQQRMIDRVKARAVLEQSEPVPLAQDVINLVISAREVVYGDDLRVDDKLFDILDKAAEAFASRVPWHDEPDEGVTCIICGIALVDGDMVYHELGEGGFIHAACCASTIESFADENGNPLNEGDPIPAPFAYESEKSLQAKLVAAPTSKGARDE